MMLGSAASGAACGESMPAGSTLSSSFTGMKEGASEPIRSKYRGLSWDKKHQGWRVRIYFSGKQRHVGRFEEDVVAAKAYDKAAVYLYGANAITNFGLDACNADPTEVSAFIVAAKEQAEQEQLARSQRQPAHGGFAGSGFFGGPGHYQQQPPPPPHGFGILQHMQHQQQHQLVQQQQQHALLSAPLDGSQGGAGAWGLTTLTVGVPAAAASSAYAGQHHGFAGSGSGGVPGGMHMPALMQQQPGQQQQQLWISSGGMAMVASQPLQQAHPNAAGGLMALGHQQQPYMVLGQVQDGSTGAGSAGGAAYVLCGAPAAGLAQGTVMLPGCSAGPACLPAGLSPNDDLAMMQAQPHAQQLVMLNSSSLPPASQAQQQQPAMATATSHVGGASCVSAAILGGASAGLDGSGGGMLPPASMGLGSLASLAPGAPMVCASGAPAGGSGSAGPNSSAGTTPLMQHMLHTIHGQQQQQHSLGTSVWCASAGSGAASLSLGSTATCLANHHVNMVCASTAADGSPTFSTSSTGSGPPAFGLCHVLPGAGSTACV